MDEEKVNKRYLLYCIVGNLVTLNPPGLAGVDGQPVFLIPHNGLTAVASMINRMNALPSISQLLAYKEVVESLHRNPSVHSLIPMRYGCIADDKAQILRLLEKHHPDYAALLEELEGCVEMGIRILIADCRLPMADFKTSIHKIENQKLQIANSGKSYLAARKAHFAQEEKINKQVKERIERCRSAFGGLFKKSKTEVPSSHNFQSSIFDRQSSIANRLPSLYFLVPEESVAAFRRAFRRLLKSSVSSSLLLSGPWPPYNFVEHENAEGGILQGSGIRDQGSGKTLSKAPASL
jgi:hypothetical protein